LCAAAKANGFSKQAMSKCAETRKLPQYQQVVQSSGLTPEQAEAELIKNELCRLMIEKIQSDSPVTEADIRKFYEDNKTRLRHGSRVKLSQILIAAPTENRGSVQSLKTQLHKSNPKVSDVDLDKQVQAIMDRQKQKAESLLTRAKSGADFAELANQNTEDMPARQAKTGGDLGFQEERRLVKEFAKEITPLKTGEVVPQLVQSPLGFHIIKVTGREDPGTVSYDECKDQIKTLLTEQKAKEVIEKWLSDQRQKAVITLSPEFLSLIAPKGANDKEKNPAAP
jgi:peptidyl-prolyl cis-trans isomerase C